MKNVEWGGFKIGDLFDSANGDFDIQKKHINGKGDFVITAGLTNNGVLGKTDVKSKLFYKNSITVDMFGAAFYRQFNYKMVTHARVFALLPKSKITYYQGLFIANSLYFLPSKFGYENMCSWNKIQDLKIQLPVKNGKIDFEFMERFVAELENEKILKLENYLNENGFSDYQLTDQEKKALVNFESGKIKLKEYKLGELFTINTYKKRFDANKVNISNKGEPYVVRTSVNNGIRGYIDEDKQFLNEGNTISFGQDTATVYYQEQPYFTGDKIKIVKSKDSFFNRKNAFYFIASMTKSFSSFSWGGSSFSVKIIKEQPIQIPVKDGKPDYETMETIISAIHKLVIKDVVLYVERKKKELNKLSELSNF